MVRDETCFTICDELKFRLWALTQRARPSSDPHSHPKNMTLPSQHGGRPLTARLANLHHPTASSSKIMTAAIQRSRLRNVPCHRRCPTSPAAIMSLPHGPVSILSDDNQVLGRSHLVLLRHRFGFGLCLSTLKLRNRLSQSDPRMVFREAPSAATPLIMIATSLSEIFHPTRSSTSALKAVRIPAPSSSCRWILAHIPGRYFAVDMSVASRRISAADPWDSLEFVVFGTDCTTFPCRYPQDVIERRFDSLRGNAFMNDLSTIVMNNQIAVISSCSCSSKSAVCVLLSSNKRFPASHMTSKRAEQCDLIRSCMA